MGIPQFLRNFTTFLSVSLLQSPWSFHFSVANRDAQHQLTPSPGPPPLDAFIARERPIAWAGLLCNIGSRAADQGECARGAGEGIVIASPQKVEPADCESP